MHYRRDRGANHYFFTLVTERRQPLLTLSDNIARLRAAFQREKTAYPFAMDAVVIMPDHLHCLWQLPDSDTDYSGRWARIKRYFSVGCAGATLATSASRSNKRERPIWQRRFWEHHIRDEEDWRRHMDYIHYNPVKHGHAANPWAWPYSSLRQCAARGWYPENWCVDTAEMIDIEAGE